MRTLWTWAVVGLLVVGLGCTSGDESSAETSSSEESKIDGGEFPEEEYGKCYDPNEYKNQPSCTVASDCGANAPDLYWECNSGCCYASYYEDPELYLCNTEEGMSPECQIAADCGADNESWYWTCENQCCYWFNRDMGIGTGNASSIISENLPESIECGEILDIVIEVKNVGATTWTEEGLYRLGAVGDENFLAPFTRLKLPDDVEVKPGETWPFSFQLFAPPASYVMNTYNLDYLTQWRMVQDYQEWFGPIVSQKVDVTCAELEEDPEDGE